MRMGLRPLRSLIALAACGLTATTLGCQSYLNQVAQQVPALAPILGGRATPTPFTLNKGNIKGFVYGAAGASQPVGLAFVTTGSISCFSAQPDQSNVVATEADDGTTISVMHDFNDGKGPVLTERRPVNPPLGPNPFDKYVYLRLGEYFLQGVPEGTANITASVGTVQSSPNVQTIYNGVTLDNINLSLFLPAPVKNEDGTTPHIIEWTGSTPDTGITVQVQPNITTNATTGQTTNTPTITYQPSPPNIVVQLKSPPGSGGVTIKQISLVYTWTTPKDTATNAPPERLGPISWTIPPFVVPPAEANAYGPPVYLTVPIGSSSLASIFGGGTTGTQDPQTTPGLVTAQIQFLDDSGFQVQGKDLGAITVSAVLRSL